MTGKKNLAYYQPAFKAITLHKNKGEGSFHHEFGHFIDHAILGNSIGSRVTDFSSNRGGTNPMPAFIRAAQQTDSYRRWIIHRRAEFGYRYRPKYVKYIQRPEEEMFARFFDQWVSRRLEEKQATPQDYQNDSWGHYGVHNQDFSEEDFKELRPLFEAVIQPHMRKALLLFLDLIKSRPKGSMNKNHAWVARFKTVGSDKWQYIMPDKKEVDSEGNLQGVKPATVLRRFFGVETEKEIEARKLSGVKAPVPYGQTQTARLITTWKIDEEGNKVATGRKLQGKIITPYGTVAAIEMSPKYAKDVEEIPTAVKQFLATPEQMDAYKEKLGASAAPAMPAAQKRSASFQPEPTLVIPLADPTKPSPDEKGIHVIPLDASVYGKLKLRGGKKNAETRTTSAINPTKAKAKAGTSLTIRVDAHDPRMVDKYGSEGALEEAIKYRPEATKLTAGKFKYTTANETALREEWSHDLYGIARAAVRDTWMHSAEYRQKYEQDEINGKYPESKNAITATWLSDKTRALVVDLKSEFWEAAREYRLNLQNPEDRFDKYILSKMYHSARNSMREEAKRAGVEVPIDAHEAHDVGAKELSPQDVADYNKYAPLGKNYLESAITELPESLRKIIEMRLWIDSPDAENKERKEIGERIGRKDEDSWEPSAEAVGSKALKHFERSFSDIVKEHPTGWIHPVTGQEVSFSSPEQATDTLERWYRSGIKNVLKHFVRKPESFGDENDDQIHDPETGLFFNHQGYAVYRWLSIATKLARSIKPRSMPAATEHDVKLETLETPGPRVNRSVRLPAKYPAIDYFEKHPILKQKMNLALGPVKFPVRLSTTARKEAPTASYMPVPLPAQYGLPETYVQHRPLKFTPEQQRRHGALQAAHAYMMTLEGKKTPELASTLKQLKAGKAAVVSRLGGHKPEQAADRMMIAGKHLKHVPTRKARAAAEKEVLKLAEGFGLHKDVQQAIELPHDFKRMESSAQRALLKDRVRRLNDLNIEDHARNLSSALREHSDKITMVDYSHGQRTGIVKSITPRANVHTFLYLFERYEEWFLTARSGDLHRESTTPRWSA